jgi:D-3-phosphoglycerate dehydrogenase / 2-oxoglutarate reductase
VRPNDRKAPRNTVLVTDYAWPSLDIERAIVAEAGGQLLVAETGCEDEIVSMAPEADAILTNWKRVSPAALDAAPRCCIVARYGVGVDNIPVDRATELGILVANVPEFCTTEVSDHALGLLLTCARRIVPFDRMTRDGRWSLEIAPGLPRLRGQTLGLVGFGRIARVLAPKALALGLHVLAYTPRLEQEDGLGVEYTNDLDRLLAESDYVSLHAPATPETQRLIGERELQAMKSTAYLINTSRGSLVDEDALARGLNEGWIAGAALDVLACEPPPADHPLLSMENVIVTPHTAFYSDAAISELQTKAARNVAMALRGEPPPTTINRPVLERPECRVWARRRPVT